MLKLLQFDLMTLTQMITKLVQTMEPHTTRFIDASVAPALMVLHVSVQVTTTAVRLGTTIVWTEEVCFDDLFVAFDLAIWLRSTRNRAKSVSGSRRNAAHRGIIKIRHHVEASVIQCYGGSLV